MTQTKQKPLVPKPPREGRSLKEVRPDIAESWSDQNPWSASEVGVASNIDALWVCEYHPEIPFIMSVNNRTNGRECGCQTGHRFVKGINDLASQRPDIAKDWHPTNEFGPDEISAVNGKVVLWICELHPEFPYEMSVRNRIAGGSCTCRNLTGRKKATRGVNDVATLHPHLIPLWHSSNTKTPYELTSMANVKIIWICPDHPTIPFLSGLSDMVKGRSSCPCKAPRRSSGVLTGVNDLATLRPDVAAQWDDEKNGTNLPSQITVGSNQKRWWKCLTNPQHKSWQTHVYARVAGDGMCPTCTHAGTSRIEAAFRVCAAQSALLTDVHPDHSKRLTIPCRGRKSLSVDIVGRLTNDNARIVVIEYDGAYYHDGVFSPKAVQRDVDKTTALLDAGCIVIRIRESGLADVAVTHPHLLQVSHVPGNNGDVSNVPDTMKAIESWLGKLY